MSRLTYERVTVRIGNQTVVLRYVRGNNPQLEKLIGVAMRSHAPTLELDLQATEENAALLGPLAWADGSAPPRIPIPPRVTPVERTTPRVVGEDGRQKATVEDVPALSRVFEELEMTVRLANVLQRGGIYFVHQAAEQTVKDLLKIRGLGQSVLREIREILWELDLGLNMNLDDVRDQLPHNIPEYSH